ncbi:MAG TPA: O-antigen ligase family protein, partial [Patescibacteria group bacterium]|nr:O-antigen ligase family protein [Patescibacteria group bacterium]
VVLLIGLLAILISGYKKQKQEYKNTTRLPARQETQEYIKIVILTLIIVVNLLAIYWSGSKGAMLGIAAGIFFYALFWAGKRKYFWPVVVVGILLAGWLWQSGRINLKGNYSVEGGDSVSVRSEMWQESWQMIKDHYILGAGLGGYQEAMVGYHKKEYIEIYLYPHNIFLNFWSEIGLLGLLAFIVIIVWYYWRGLAHAKSGGKEIKVILMAAMTAIIIHGLVDVPYFKNDLSVFFWLMIGLMFIVNIGQKSQDGV